MKNIYSIRFYLQILIGFPAEFLRLNINFQVRIFNFVRLNMILNAGFNMSTKVGINMTCVHMATNVSINMTTTNVGINTTMYVSIAIYDFLFATYCLLAAFCYLKYADCSWLFAVCCLLFVVCYLLIGDCCLLFAVCYLLSPALNSPH